MLASSRVFTESGLGRGDAVVGGCLALDVGMPAGSIEGGTLEGEQL